MSEQPQPPSVASIVQQWQASLEDFSRAADEAAASSREAMIATIRLGLAYEVTGLRKREMRVCRPHGNGSFAVVWLSDGRWTVVRIGRRRSGRQYFAWKDLTYWSPVSSGKGRRIVDRLRDLRAMNPPVLLPLILGGSSPVARSLHRLGYP